MITRLRFHLPALAFALAVGLSPALPGPLAAQWDGWTGVSLGVAASAGGVGVGFGLTHWNGSLGSFGPWSHPYATHGVYGRGLGPVPVGVHAFRDCFDPWYGYRYDPWYPGTYYGCPGPPGYRRFQHRRHAFRFYDWWPRQRGLYVSIYVNDPWAAPWGGPWWAYDRPYRAGWLGPRYGGYWGSWGSWGSGWLGPRTVVVDGGSWDGRTGRTAVPRGSAAGRSGSSGSVFKEDPQSLAGSGRDRTATPRASTVPRSNPGTVSPRSPATIRGTAGRGAGEGGIRPTERAGLRPRASGASVTPPTPRGARGSAGLREVVGGSRPSDAVRSGATRAVTRQGGVRPGATPRDATTGRDVTTPRDARTRGDLARPRGETTRRDVTTGRGTTRGSAVRPRPTEGASTRGGAPTRARPSIGVRPDGGVRSGGTRGAVGRSSGTPGTRPPAAARSGASRGGGAAVRPPARTRIPSARSGAVPGRSGATRSVAPPPRASRGSGAAAARARPPVRSGAVRSSAGRREAGSRRGGGD